MEIVRLRGKWVEKTGLCKYSYGEEPRLHPPWSYGQRLAGAKGLLDHFWLGKSRDFKDFGEKLPPFDPMFRVSTVRSFAGESTKWSGFASRVFARRSSVGFIFFQQAILCSTVDQLLIIWFWRHDPLNGSKLNGWLE